MESMMEEQEKLKQQNTNPEPEENENPDSEKSGEYLEKLQRLQAEFDNYRKRTNRERQQVADRARMQIMTDFLDLCDNLEQAINTGHPDESEDVAAYREGIQLILKNFREFLEKEGVEPMQVEGKTFDPNYHEAMMVQESDEENSGKVAKELRKGYMYKDQVIRPARDAVFE